MDIAIGAMQVRGEAPGGDGFRPLPMNVDRDPPLAHPQRRLQGLDHPVAAGSAQAKAVLHHFQGVVFLRLDAGVSLPLQKLAHLPLREIGGHRDRKGDGEPRIAGCAGALGQGLVDALGRVPAHPLAAAPAVKLGGAGEKQLQVVGELGHGAHGGTGGPHRVYLVDGDGGRYAVDAVHPGSVLAVEELAGVGREGLHVAALSLGVEGVEGEGRFAGAGNAGDDDQLVQGKPEAQTLQVVLAGSFEGDVFAGHGGFSDNVNSCKARPEIDEVLHAPFQAQSYWKHLAANSHRQPVIDHSFHGPGRRSEPARTSVSFPTGLPGPGTSAPFPPRQAFPPSVATL
ncbi:MAG: hypothetical protein KatS3mg123_0260 [Burkholderiales bacterium]|nr:MAG: hypothetical protein KatS3mg123_0260 [Burkholderiales bacterium]